MLRQCIRSLTLQQLSFMYMLTSLSWQGRIFSTDYSIYLVLNIWFSTRTFPCQLLIRMCTSWPTGPIFWQTFYDITVSYDKASAFHKGLAEFLKSTPKPSIVLSAAWLKWILRVIYGTLSQWIKLYRSTQNSSNYGHASPKFSVS